MTWPGPLFRVSQAAIKVLLGCRLLQRPTKVIGHVQLLMAKKTRPPFPCWLSAWSHSQVALIYCNIALSTFKASKRIFFSLNSSHALNMTSLSLATKLRFKGLRGLRQAYQDNVFLLESSLPQNITQSQVWWLIRFIGWDIMQAVYPRDQGLGKCQRKPKPDHS